MNPLSASQIKGNWAAVMLPVNSDQSIDYGRLAAQLDYLVESGLNGIYTNGTAAEFHTQNEDEFDRISQMVAERCEPAAVNFQIGAGHMSPQTSLARIRRAKQLQPAAMQVILSDWYPLADDEMLACMEVFLEASDPVGLVLYNPPHAKRVLKPADFALLADNFPALVGIKVLDGDDRWYQQMRPLAQRLSIFVPGSNLATGITRGAAGAYSNVACMNPRGAQRWYEQMLTDIQAALEFQARFQRFINEHLFPLAKKQSLSNPALDKFMAVLGGWTDMEPRLRWPYNSASDEDVRRFRPIARELLPELFNE